MVEIASRRHDFSPRPGSNKGLYGILSESLWEHEPIAQPQKATTRSYLFLNAPFFVHAECFLGGRLAGSDQRPIRALRDAARCIPTHDPGSWQRKGCNSCCRDSRRRPRSSIDDSAEADGWRNFAMSPRFEVMTRLPRPPQRGLARHRQSPSHKSSRRTKCSANCTASAAIGLAAAVISMFVAPAAQAQSEQQALVVKAHDHAIEFHARSGDDLIQKNLRRAGRR